MVIGKIVKSSSHINYSCQISGPLEVEVLPDPADYAFGRFVRVAVRSRLANVLRIRQDADPHSNEEPCCYMVGVIYDSMLLNPSFGFIGPRLSTEPQVEMFSPDYLAEQAVLVQVIMLGMMEHHMSSRSPFKLHIVHGIPSFPLELNSSVQTMADEDIQRFHFFDDQGHAEKQHAYLHLGYLPHLLAQQNNLIPQVILQIIDQLEQLFPQHRVLLSMLKRNFAWRLKVQTTG